MTDTGKLTGAIVRAPGRSLVAGLTAASLGKPDYARALQQHSAYCEALEACGLTLTRLEADERFPDSTFIEDTAVLIRSVVKDDDASGTTAILTRPGAPTRAKEVELSTQVLSQFCKQMISLEAPGTLDGGDICEANDHFFTGISERTNEAGAQQLAALLTSAGYTSAFIDIRGEQGILHLKSGLAFIGDNCLVVIDALADRPEFSEFELIRLDAAEEYAANCVRVNDHVLIAAGYPKLERSLQNLGYSTIALEMSEFQKLDGGLSCLSLRF
jgi:dimethylargininase